MEMEFILWIVLGLCFLAIVAYVVMNMNAGKDCPDTTVSDDVTGTPGPKTLMAEVTKITVRGGDWIIELDGPIEDVLEGDLSMAFIGADGILLESIDIAKDDYEVIGINAILLEAVPGRAVSDIKRVVIGY
jgi:hypothetical protein